jgi:hypothetical protein
MNEMKEDKKAKDTHCVEFVYRGPCFYEVEVANRVERMLSGGIPRVDLDGELIVSTDASEMVQHCKFRKDNTAPPRNNSSMDHQLN